MTGAWPRVTVVDRRQSDPHDGVLARESLDAAYRALDGDGPVAVVVVLQRLGDGRLLACAKCGELARCEVCGQAEEEVGWGVGLSRAPRAAGQLLSNLRRDEPAARSARRDDFGARRCGAARPARQRSDRDE